MQATSTAYSAVLMTRSLLEDGILPPVRSVIR